MLGDLVVEVLHCPAADEAVVRNDVAPAAPDEAADVAVREVIARDAPRAHLIVQVQRLDRGLLHPRPGGGVEDAAEAVPAEGVAAVGERAPVLA